MSLEREESFRRLAWTMAGLVAALGPHLLRLQVWVSAFVLGVCAWRLIAERRGWRMPVAFVRGMIAAGVTVAVVLGYSTITGLDGGTALLALMSALKLLETRTARDHAILIFIGWFLCLASFFYAQDIATCRVGVADRLAARGGAVRGLAPRTGRARAASFPHDRRHAAESCASCPRPLLLLSAGRGQLLGRAIVGPGVDGPHRGNVARRHLGPHAQ
jgi:hypothetical protein